MPSVVGHALVGAAAALYGRTWTPPRLQRPTLAASVLLALLPDIDAVGFHLGVPYASPLGHRGLTHSLLFALLAATAATLALRHRWREPVPATAAVLVVSAASHPLLDMLTTGGLGVALWAPLAWSRLFFGWRPIPVSPIGLGPTLGAVVLWELVMLLPLLGGALIANASPRAGLKLGGAVLGLAGTALAMQFRLGF